MAGIARHDGEMQTSVTSCNVLERHTPRTSVPGDHATAFHNGQSISGAASRNGSAIGERAVERVSRAAQIFTNRFSSPMGERETGEGERLARSLARSRARTMFPRRCRDLARSHGPRGRCRSPSAFVVSTKNVPRPTMRRRNRS